MYTALLIWQLGRAWQETCQNHDLNGDFKDTVRQGLDEKSSSCQGRHELFGAHNTGMEDGAREG
jgi:hypothetical protein